MKILYNFIYVYYSFDLGNFSLNYSLLMIIARVYLILSALLAILFSRNVMSSCQITCTNGYNDPK